MMFFLVPFMSLNLCSIKPGLTIDFIRKWTSPKQNTTHHMRSAFNVPKLQ